MTSLKIKNEDQTLNSFNSYNLSGNQSFTGNKIFEGSIGLGVTITNSNLTDIGTGGIRMDGKVVIGIEQSGQKNIDEASLNILNTDFCLTCPNGYSDAFKPQIYSKWEDGSYKHQVGMRYSLFDNANNNTSDTHSIIEFWSNKIKDEDLAGDTGSLLMGRIHSDSRWVIGTIAGGTAQLTVHQANATFANPVLELDQDDINEAFINFAGTSTGDANSSLSTFTTGATAGHIRCEVNGSTTIWIPYATTISA